MNGTAQTWFVSRVCQFEIVSRSSVLNFWIFCRKFHAFEFFWYWQSMDAWSFSGKILVCGPNFMRFGFWQKLTHRQQPLDLLPWRGDSVWQATAARLRVSTSSSSTPECRIYPRRRDGSHLPIATCSNPAVLSKQSFLHNSC